MVSFDPSTPIIDAEPDFRPFRPGARRHVLWPVLAWKVLVVEPQPRTFDVFQTAILRLCAAGICQIAAIADRLALHPDLVAFILLQLQGMGLLDAQGRPSLRALRLLERDEDPAGVDSVGYVFVDALGRRTWPRFWRGNLPYTNGVLEGPGQGAWLSRGDEGDPQRERAWVLWPSSTPDAMPPSAHAIMRAARLHQRRLARFRMSIGDLGGAARASMTDTTAGAEKRVKRVRIVGQTPQPVFVTTCMFVPQESQEGWWQICDPFALGVSSELRAQVEQLIKEGHDGLRKLIEKLTGSALQVDPAELADMSRSTAAQSLTRLRGQLGPALDALSPEVQRQLVTADEHLARARALRRGAQADRANVLKSIEDFFGVAYAALEQRLAELVALFADEELLAPLSRHAHPNRRLLEQLARHIGFHIDADAERAGLFAVTHGQVKGAICFRNLALPGNLAAALLAARERAEHPLRRLAREFPDALPYFERLKRVRDSTSHHTDIEPDLIGAEGAASDLHRVLRLLADARAEVRGPSLTDPASVEVWTAELMARLRGQAARQVYARAPEVEDDPNLRVRLIDLQQKALELEYLQAGGAEPEPLQLRLRDFAVAAALVIETGLVALHEAAGRAPQELRAATTRQALARDAARAVAQLGFTLQRGQLPEELAAVRPERVQKALASQRESLSATLIALALHAAQDRDHPLRRLAADAPGLFLDVAQVARARGHGDSTPITIRDVKPITDIAFRLARTLVSVI